MTEPSQPSSLTNGTATQESSTAPTPTPMASATAPIPPQPPAIPAAAPAVASTTTTTEAKPPAAAAPASAPVPAPAPTRTVIASAGITEESDDEDVPLAALAKKPPAAAAAAAASPKPPQAVKTEVKAEKGPPAAAPAAAAVPAKWENDDDTPISELMRYGPNGALKKRKDSEGGGGGGEAKKVKVEKAAAAEEEKQRKDKKKKKKKDKERERERERERPAPMRSTTNSGSGGKDVTQKFYALDKGELVQKLLRRWWYAMEWPDPACKTSAPPDYETLEGYPGVFVCVRGPKIGHVEDRRNHADCPNFTNFSRKPAAELKTLLLKALEEQRRQLKEHEGSNYKLEKRLEKEKKWVEKLDAARADKEARKKGFEVLESGSP